LKPIITLQELIHQLSVSSKENYNYVLQNFLLDRKQLSKFEHWSHEKYVRNGIYKDESFEIILMCWERNQETPIHCHGGEECWMYVLQGELEEQFYKKDNKDNLVLTNAQKLYVSNSSYINDTVGLHKIKNSFEGQSLSLHIYAKPILSCSFYDEGDGEFKRKTLSYDTFEGEPCNPKLLIGNIN